MAGQAVRQGKRTQLGITFERVKAGFKGLATMKFIHVKSLEIIPTRPLERAGNNNPRGQRQPGRNLAVVQPLKFVTQPVIDEILPLLAHFFGMWAHTTPAVGVEQFAFRPRNSGDVSPADVSTFSYEGDIDGLCQLGLNTVLTKVDLKWDAGKFNEVSFEGMSARSTRLADPAKVAGSNANTYTGNGGVPLIRGYLDPTTDLLDPIIVECTTPGAIGVAKITAYRESTGIGAGDEQLVTGKFQRLINSDDDSLATFSGNVDDPLEICFPIGGTLTDADKWTIGCRRVKVVATYPLKNELTAVAVTTELDGVEYVIQSGSFSAMNPIVAWEGGGSKYCYGFLENGEQEYGLTLKRKNTDDVLLNAWEAERTLPVRIVSEGGLLTPAFREKIQIDLAATQISKAGSNQTSQAALDEDIALDAVDNGVDPVAVLTVVTGVATI